MAKTYQTVKTAIFVDREIERAELRRINSCGGNAFMPSPDDIEAMSMTFEDETDDLDAELAALAQELLDCDE